MSHPFTIVSIRRIINPNIKIKWRRGYSKNVSKALNQLFALDEVMQSLKNNVLRHLFYKISLTKPYDYVK